MRVSFNIELDFSKEKVWAAKNGATKRTLIVVSKIGNVGKTDIIRAKVGYLDKGSHSFIFLNPEDGYKKDEMIGIFLCSEYGYRIVNSSELTTLPEGFIFVDKKIYKVNKKNDYTRPNVYWAGGILRDYYTGANDLHSNSEINYERGHFLDSPFVFYEYKWIKGELFSNSSVGGYGNSESKFGIYSVGAILAANSYKSRQGETFWELTPGGWLNKGKDVPVGEDGDEIQQV